MHTPEPVTSRAPFRQRQQYVEALLNDLTEARQQGLTLEQVKVNLSLEKRYAYVRQYFAKPDDLDARHEAHTGRRG